MFSPLSSSALRMRFYQRVANMVCVAEKRATPDGLSYAVCARLDVPTDPNNSTIGVVTHGGFVEADPANPLLPQDHTSRYTTRLW